jgi:hypothetical protein
VGPRRRLYFQEGTFLHSQVETPFGTVRLENAGVWRYEPRTEKLRVFVSYAFANPWGHVIDGWGENIARPTTANGLQVVCRLDRRKYRTGRRISDARMTTLNLSTAIGPHTSRPGRTATSR